MQCRDKGKDDGGNVKGSGEPGREVRLRGGHNDATVAFGQRRSNTRSAGTAGAWEDGTCSLAEVEATARVQPTKAAVVTPAPPAPIPKMDAVASASLMWSS